MKVPMKNLYTGAQIPGKILDPDCDADQHDQSQDRGYDRQLAFLFIHACLLLFVLERILHGIYAIKIISFTVHAQERV